MGAFFVSAPLVVLYTAGYRLNFTHLSLVKTGLLSITTVPKGAAIYLDGKIKASSPAVLENIMPGVHKIRLEKTDYLTWEKDLEIKEQETTFAPKVILFSDQMAVLEEQQIFLTAAFSPSGYRLAYVLDQSGWWEIWTKNFLNDEKKLLLRLPQNQINDLELTWSANGNNLLVKETQKTARRWEIVDANGANRFVVEDFLKISPGETIISVDLDPFDDNVASVQTKTATWRLKLTENKAEKLLDEPAALWSRGELLLFLRPTKDGQELTRREKDRTEQVVAKIAASDYEFLPAPPTLVLLKDKKRNKIILIDDRGVDKPIYLEAEALMANWNPNNKKQLLYVSDFELHVFDVEKQTDELLTRVSAPITQASWHPSGSDVLFSDGKNLSAIELDKRGIGRQVFFLASLDSLSSFTVSNDGETLFLCGETNGESGIFERRLKN